MQVGAVATTVFAARLRVGWRSLLGIVVVAGLGFGGSFALIATARRTASAHDRYFESVGAYDYATGFAVDLVGEPMDEALVGVPGLVETQQLAGFLMAIDGVSATDIDFFFAWVDDVARMERPTLVEGRLPSADAPGEAVLNEEAAQRSGLAVGDTRSASFETANYETGGFERAATTTAVTIVGVIRMPDEFLLDEYRRQGLMMLSPAFGRDHAELAAYGNVWLRMAPGAPVQPVLEALADLGLAFDENRDQERGRVWQSIRALVTVVGTTGALAFLATWGLLVLVLARRWQRDARADQIIRSLGGTRRDLLVGRLLLASLIAVGLAVVAAGSMIAASPLAPIGPYRDVDPARGPFVDWLVLAPGLMLVVLTALGTAGAVRTQRGRARAGLPRRGSRSLPVATRLGLRWAFDVRSRGRFGGGALAAAALSCAVVVATVVVLGSLSELGRQPAWYGNQWDAVARLSFGRIDPATLLDGDPVVSGHSGAIIEGGSVDGEPVAILGVGGSDGSGTPLWPLVTSGRAPANANEALIGDGTRERLDVGIGDTIVVTQQDHFVAVTTGSFTPTFEVTVVGTAIFPNAGFRGTDPPRLGEGIAVDQSVLSNEGGEADTGALLFVDLVDGTDVDAFIARHDDVVGVQTPFVIDWLVDLEPVEVEQTSSVTPLMWAFVIGLGAVVAALVASVLATAVRSRRREYGLLRALGFTTRQFATAVAVHAYSALAVAAAAGALVGVLAGRRLWTEFADRLDVLPRATVPIAALMVGAGCAVIVVGLVLLPVAARVQRTPAARSLRAE